MIDSSTALAFSLFENKGVYALLLGSGLSRSAQIPTGWEITLDLIHRVAALKGVTGESDLAGWYRGQTGTEPDYSAILDKLTSTPEERRSILHSYIEPTEAEIDEGKKIPTKAHHAIAWLVREGFIKVILTTNFDRLMENALREAGVEPTVIRSDDDLSGAIPLIHSRCFIVKLHGDYLDTRIKNTDEELRAYSPRLDALLDRILDDHGLIACGWSGDWDHALRAAITRAPNRRFPTFWAARGAPSSKATDLIAQRSAKLISIVDADTFFVGLQQKVIDQAETQRTDPRSIKMLVAATKRYLSRPEFRIPLNDLLADELRSLTGKIGETEFSRNEQGSPEEYRSRVARYEAATEPLIRMFGIIGRWGDEATHSLCCETLRSLADLKTEGGMNWWLDLRFYPSALLFYAYGLGLLQAERYDLLFHWFDHLNGVEDRKPVPMGYRVASWQSETFDRWKMLEGLDRRKTALSDHMHEISDSWASDYVIATGNHTLLFETFEVLASLAYLTTAATKEGLKEAHDVDGHERNFVWCPLGRFAWDSQTRERILTRFRQTDFSKLLLEAGFARGDHTYLALAIDNIRRLIGRSGLAF